MPDVPQVIVDANPDMDIEYLGALARSQRMDQAQAVERWAMSLGNLSQVMPGVLDVPDDEAIARELGMLLNVDPTLMNSKEEVDMRRQQRAQQQAMMERQEMIARSGEAAQSVGEGEAALKAVE